MLFILDAWPRAPVCGWALENAARRRGAPRIAGLDEVGRGPMFGPVVAAAVILPKGCRLQGLTDSKQLTEKQRNEFDLSDSRAGRGVGSCGGGCGDDRPHQYPAGFAAGDADGRGAAGGCAGLSASGLSAD